MMPLIVKEFTWHQSPEKISLCVNIKGVSKDKTNILTSNNYIRIHCHPYIFEAFLWDEVEDSQGSCTIDKNSGQVIIQLPKSIQGKEWMALENKELDRSQKKELREAAVSHSHKRHAQTVQSKASLCQEQKQLSVQEQIRLDDEERQRISAIKRAESKKALDEMEEWQRKNEMIEGLAQNSKSSKFQKTGARSEEPNKERVEDRLMKLADRTYGSLRGGKKEMSLEELIKKGPSKVTLIPSEDEDDLELIGAGGDAQEVNPSGGEIWLNNDLNVDIVEQSGSGERKPKQEEIQVKKDSSSLDADVGRKNKEIPGIRSSTKISVKFTQRELPTPARESNLVEEQEWLKKQSEARRRSGFDDADLRPEERDPAWLLNKGLSLMEKGCHLGGVSAFSLGIKLSPKMPELYLERANAHLILRNFIKAVEDCSHALDLLTPKVAGNFSERFRSHVIRGTAFQEMRMNRESLMDLKAAVLLKPEDLKLYDQFVQVQGLVDAKVLHGFDESASENDECD